MKKNIGTNDCIYSFMQFSLSLFDVQFVTSIYCSYCVMEVFVNSFFLNFTRQCLPLLESLKSVKSILGSGLNIYKPWLEKQSTATHFQRCFIANFYYKNFATFKLKIRKKKLVHLLQLSEYSLGNRGSMFEQKKRKFFFQCCLRTKCYLPLLQYNVF